MSLVTYPSLDIAPRHQTSDILHGSEVSDPYRWLEEDSDDTKAWINAQVKLTDVYMSSHCAENIDKLSSRLTSMWNFERNSCPFRHGNIYYYWNNTGLQNQSVLFGQKTLEDNPFVVLNPNTIEDDGTAAVKSIEFTERGDFMVYSVSRSGSDWVTLHVKNMTTLTDTSDVLEWVKFSSLSWTHDGKGFFYCRYPAPASLENTDENVDRGTEVDAAKLQAVYYHVMNTKQEEDECVFMNQQYPDHMYSMQVSECGDYVVLSTSESCDPANQIHIARIESTNNYSKLDFLPLVSTFSHEFGYITNTKTEFLFRTNLNASCYRIVKIDIAALLHASNTNITFDEVLPESKDVLEYVECCGNDKLFVGYVHDVKSVVKLFHLSGQFLHDIELPTLGQVIGVSAQRKFDEVFYKFQSFAYAGTIFRLNVSNGDSIIFKEVKVNGINHTDFHVEQKFFRSLDNTLIPMFLIARQNRDTSKPSPTLLYGYGGFNISLLPSFSVTRLAFIQSFNGVVAIANLRGGGEYGDEWHKAGTKQHKQNVFDDFHAAAEFLINQKYTTSQQLSIMGGSNGGLLVAAAVNQRPDLYRCAIAQVGVMDMIRFHRFTIGYAWCSDYGNADNNQEDFDALIQYSPYHNVGTSKEPYPAMLLCTADHDDRVVPLHSFKLAARLQHDIGNRENQINPLLIRIDVKAGHGAGKPLSKTIREYADVLSFIAHSLHAKFVE